MECQIVQEILPQFELVKLFVSMNLSGLIPSIGVVSFDWKSFSARFTSAMVSEIDERERRIFLREE